MVLSCSTQRQSKCCKYRYQDQRTWILVYAVKVPIIYLLHTLAEDLCKGQTAEEQLKYVYSLDRVSLFLARYIILLPSSMVLPCTE